MINDWSLKDVIETEILEIVNGFVVHAWKNDRLKQTIILTHLVH